MSAETKLLSPEIALPASYTEGLEHRIRDRLRIQRLRTGRRTFANRFALGLALSGPGLLVMLGDNDAAASSPMRRLMCRLRSEKR
jgi:hypothetical protein